MGPLIYHATSLVLVPPAPRSPNHGQKIKLDVDGTKVQLVGSKGKRQGFVENTSLDMEMQDVSPYTEALEEKRQAGQASPLVAQVLYPPLVAQMGGHRGSGAGLAYKVAPITLEVSQDSMLRKGRPEEAGRSPRRSSGGGSPHRNSRPQLVCDGLGDFRKAADTRTSKKAEGSF